MATQAAASADTITDDRVRDLGCGTTPYWNHEGQESPANPVSSGPSSREDLDDDDDEGDHEEKVHEAAGHDSPEQAEGP